VVGLGSCCDGRVEQVSALSAVLESTMGPAGLVEEDSGSASSFEMLVESDDWVLLASPESAMGPAGLVEEDSGPATSV
jgi:hypothetical protein